MVKVALCSPCVGYSSSLGMAEHDAAGVHASGWGKEVRRPEVELPDAHLPVALRQVALSVGEGQAQLDELQHVHIAPESMPMSRHHVSAS